MLEVAAENATASGMGDRFHRVGGNAFDAQFGEGYDLALVTNFLHHFDAPRLSASCASFTLL